MKAVLVRLHITVVRAEAIVRNASLSVRSLSLLFARTCLLELLLGPQVIRGVV